MNWFQRNRGPRRYLHAKRGVVSPGYVYIGVFVESMQTLMYEYCRCEVSHVMSESERECILMSACACACACVYDAMPAIMRGAMPSCPDHGLSETSTGGQSIPTPDPTPLITNSV